MFKEATVGTNPDPLGDNYKHNDIPIREQQIRELTFCLYPTLKRKKPINAWLYGSPSSGKTITAKFILKKFRHEANVEGAYINCWEQHSYYSVLDKLVRELRILGAEKLNTSFKLERLKQFLGDRPFLIVLDEIDKPKNQERDSIISVQLGISVCSACAIPGLRSIHWMKG